MKTKKIVSLFLALALVFSFVPAAFAALTPAEIALTTPEGIEAVAEATEQVYKSKHNFADQAPDLVFEVSAASVLKKNLLDADGKADTATTFDKSDYQIDFLNEKLIINPLLLKKDTDGVTDIIDETKSAGLHPVKFISFDGGNKWAPVTIPAGGLDISKQLNKSVTIVLTSNLDTTVKPNAPKEGDAGAKLETTDDPGYRAPVAGHVTYTFGATAERPKAAKFKPNFLTYSAYDQWAPADGVDATKLDISVADSTGKAPVNGWYKFLTAKAVAAEGSGYEEGYKGFGINVQDLINGKPGKIVYLVRLSPDPKTMTPASAPFKLGVPTYQKAPTFKIDYKKEIIKVKEFTEWDLADDDDVKYFNSIGEEVDSDDVYDFKGELMDGYTAVQYKKIDVGGLYDSSGGTVKYYNATKVGDLLVSNKMTKDDAKAGIKLVTDKYDLYDRRLGLRIGASEKKPASAVQIIDVAPQTELFQVDFKPSFAKGKMIVDKKVYEFYDAGKGKWGGAPKEAGTYKVRIKNTAKYDVKTNKTIGAVMSQPMEVTLVSGSYDAKKPEKVGLVSHTVKSFPLYDGLVWVAGINNGEEGDANAAVSALKIDGTIAGEATASSYMTYIDDGFQVAFPLLTPDIDASGKYTGVPYEDAEDDVLVNPTAAQLAALEPESRTVIVTVASPILDGVASNAITAAIDDGVLTLTVKANDNESDTTPAEKATWTDMADSIALSLYYAPYPETAKTNWNESLHEEEARNILLASKFYSPVVPVTVTEPRVKVTVPNIEGMVVKANIGTNQADVDIPEEGILLSQIDATAKLVITLAPGAASEGKLFFGTTTAGGAKAIKGTDGDTTLALAKAAFSVKLGTADKTASYITAADVTTGVITITVPKGDIQGDVTVAVTGAEGTTLSASKWVSLAYTKPTATTDYTLSVAGLFNDATADITAKIIPTDGSKNIVITATAADGKKLQVGENEITATNVAGLAKVAGTALETGATLTGVTKFVFTISPTQLNGKVVAIDLSSLKAVAAE